MTYAALLRGINVGGNNKVDMKILKALFEDAGMDHVKTYINSGNVIFHSSSHSPHKIVRILEQSIESTFGFFVKVLIIDITKIKNIVHSLPSTWVNDATMKCDVMFLWDDYDSPNTVKQLTINPDIDDVKYIPGALLWRIDKEHVTKSGMMKIVGLPLYKNMTVRNCNTTRKLYDLMVETEKLSR